MKNLIRLGVLIVLLQSCVIGQEPVENDQTVSSANSKYIKDILLKEGYEPGTVKLLKDSDCTFVIVKESTTKNLDPINFNISGFEEFRKKDLKIYFKYKPLGILNRCSDTSPIELLSVVKRVD